MKKYLLPSLTFSLFIINTLLILFNKTYAVDNFVHQYMFKDLYPNLINIMNAFTFLGSTLYMIIFSIILVIIFYLLKDKIKSFSVAILIIVSTILNNVIKIIVQRPRPVYMTVNETSLSYPSGHTMASVTLYGLLIYFVFKSNLKTLYKVLLIILLTLIIIGVIVSRIYLGAHYFTDVLGGALVSLTLLFSYNIFMLKRSSK